MRRVLLAAAVVLGLASASAADLKLVGDRYWIVLASRPSRNEAIAFARRYDALRPAVVSTTKGWYAVVVGPRTIAPGLGRATLEAMAKSDAIPKDAYLTRGEGYADVVWTAPPSPVIAAVTYDGKTDAVLESGPLKVVISSMPAHGTERTPVATGTFEGRPAFTMAADSDYPTDVPAAEASLIRLDASSPAPQVVLTYFWQGAHCCTVTRIATMRPDKTWAVVNGETLDGDGGYRFEDLAGSGEVDMTSADQSFYYAFSSYADSVAPIRIHQLLGDRLVDVTREPRFYDFLLQELAGLEDGLRPDDAAWHDNGFLAGWVAEKMLVGQGAEAWARMLAGYDRHPDFGPERCSVDRPVDSCPDDKRVRIDFPVALKPFLTNGGYILDPALYPTSRRAASPVPASDPAAAVAPSGIRPALQQCIDASDAARRLIYQALVGRRLQPGESYDVVRLEGDTTLEANDQSTGRVVCAVTYDLDLKGLVAELAGRGDAARADALGKAMRASGPTTSTRVKYSVKPTVTPGQNYVELLP